MKTALCGTPIPDVDTEHQLHCPICRARFINGSDNCRKCGGEMKDGIALQNTLTMGTPDFPGSTRSSRGQTLTRNGPAEEVEVLKCSECGHSITK